MKEEPIFGSFIYIFLCLDICQISHQLISFVIISACTEASDDEKEADLSDKTLIFLIKKK